MMTARFAVLLALGVTSVLARPAAAQIDLTPRPIERLPEGQFTLQALPNGYSHVVMLAWPRLTPEGQKAAPGMAGKFAQTFGLLIVADVRRTPGPEGGFRLNRLAMGHTMRADGKSMVVRPDSKELTFLASQVLSSGEKELDKVRQIARYDTAILFETPAIMLRGGEHVELKLRQFVWTSAKHGGLASAMWLIDYSQPQAPRVADNFFVQLPAGFVEDRVLSVDSQAFNMLGMPSPTAFALARLPQGTKIPFTPELARLAATPAYTQQTLPQLAQQLATAIATNPISAVGAR